MKAKIMQLYEFFIIMSLCSLKLISSKSNISYDGNLRVRPINRICFPLNISASFFLDALDEKLTSQAAYLSYISYRNWEKNIDGSTLLSITFDLRSQEKNLIRFMGSGASCLKCILSHVKLLLHSFFSELKSKTSSLLRDHEAIS